MNETIEKTRICTICGRELPESEFRKSRNGKSRNHTCTNCISNRMRRASNNVSEIEFRRAIVTLIKMNSEFFGPILVDEPLAVQQMRALAETINSYLEK